MPVQIAGRFIGIDNQDEGSLVLKYIDPAVPRIPILTSRRSYRKLEVDGGLSGGRRPFVRMFIRGAPSRARLLVRRLTNCAFDHGRTARPNIAATSPKNR